MLIDGTRIDPFLDGAHAHQTPDRNHRQNRRLPPSIPRPDQCCGTDPNQRPAGVRNESRRGDPERQQAPCYLCFLVGMGEGLPFGLPASGAALVFGPRNAEGFALDALVRADGLLPM